MKVEPEVMEGKPCMCCGQKYCPSDMAVITRHSTHTDATRSGTVAMNITLYHTHERCVEKMKARLKKDRNHREFMGYERG